MIDLPPFFDGDVDDEGDAVRGSSLLDDLELVFCLLIEADELPERVEPVTATIFVDTTPALEL